MSDYKIQGLVNLDGTPVSGSRVRLHNQDLDEYKGDTLSDATGSFQFDLTESEAIEPLGGSVDLKGLDFDGTDDYVSLGTLNGLFNNIETTGLSVGCWFKTIAPGILAGISNDTTPQSFFTGVLYLQITSTDAVRVLFRNDEGNRVQITVTVPFPASPTDGNYHNIVFTFNPSGDIGKLYFDGEELASIDGETGNYNLTWDHPFVIGAYNSRGTIASHLDGAVSEFQIWNKTLTQLEIQENMNKQLCGDETGLVGYWRLDEIVNGEVIDYAGTNDGTVFSSPTPVTADKNLLECEEITPYNFHVSCEYESGSVQHQSLSFPYIKPVENI